jgi:hypothetical protein
MYKCCFVLGMSSKSSVHLSHPKVVQIPPTCQCCAIIWSDHKRAWRSSYRYNKPTKQVCCSRTSMDSGCTRAWPGCQDISCLHCSKISCSKIYWLLDQVHISCASADHLVTASFVVILWCGQFQTWTGKSVNDGAQKLHWIMMKNSHICLILHSGRVQLA